MKRNLFIILGLFLIVLTEDECAFAGNSPSNSLDQTVALYESQDYKRFLKSLSALTADQPGIVAARPDIKIMEIGALFYLRKFEQVDEKVKVLQMERLTAKQTALLKEYEIATLFENGYKKLSEAAGMIGNMAQFKRRAEGAASFQKFLAVANTLPMGRYLYLSRRNLDDNVITATVAIESDPEGDEKLVQRGFAREHVLFLRIKTNLRLRPDWPRENLSLMKQFISEFPQSVNRSRMDFEIATLSFHIGETLVKEAQELEASGETDAGNERRTSASPLFKQLRLLAKGIIENKTSGIELSDVIDIREDVLASYLLEKDYAGLRSAINEMLKTSNTGDHEWLTATLFQGIVLIEEKKNFHAAATVFDRMLKRGFTGKPDHDRLISSAARWRIRAAQLSGNYEKIEEVVRFIESSQCTKNIKADFLKDMHK